MKCKHNWIPIWEHKIHDYHYQCTQCNKIIWTPKKRQEWAN